MVGQDRRVHYRPRMRWGVGLWRSLWCHGFCEGATQDEAAALTTARMTTDLSRVTCRACLRRAVLVATDRLREEKGDE